jgi:hypothetical protein
MRPRSGRPEVETSDGSASASVQRILARTTRRPPMDRRTNWRHMLYSLAAMATLLVAAGARWKPK